MLTAALRGNTCGEWIGSFRKAKQIIVTGCVLYFYRMKLFKVNKFLFGLFVAYLVCSSVVFAEIDSPWVTSDAEVSAGYASPNTFSIEAFHESPMFKGLSPKEFAHRVFDIYYDGRRKNWLNFTRGLTLWGHSEQEARANQHVIEYDPILLLNVYGSGYCGMQSGLLEGIYQTRPGGSPGKPALDARRWFLGGIIHSVTDVYYDGGWHYFDIDLGGWAGNEDKGVWSMADVIFDPQGYYGKETPLKSKYFFRADGNGRWVLKIDPKKSYTFQDNLMVGHEMAFSLRKGESFTRYFSAEAAGWSELPPFTKKIPRQQKGFFEMIYEPAKEDIEDGVLYKEPGYKIFAVRAPYNITSSKVEHTGEAFISKDLGQNWRLLGADGMAKEAVNHWDYLLKIENGELQKITTRGMLHPASLPRISKKETKITVSKMNNYKILTYIPDWSTKTSFDRTAFLSQGLKYSPGKKNSLNGGKVAGRGQTVIPVKAPPGSKIVKLSATVRGLTSTKPDPKKHFELFIGSKGESKLVGRSTDCSGWGTSPEAKVEHAETTVNGSATFKPTGQAEVKINVNGYGSINSVRIYVGYIEKEKKEKDDTLMITHGFDGKTFSFAAPASKLNKESMSYNVPPAKRNEYIRMEVS